MQFADTRRKLVTQFFALPKCFSDVTVREHEVARNDEDLICVKLRTAYTAPVLGTKEIKHLISLSLDNTDAVSVPWRARQISEVMAYSCAYVDSAYPVPQGPVEREGVGLPILRCTALANFALPDMVATATTASAQCSRS